MTIAATTDTASGSPAGTAAFGIRRPRRIHRAVWRIADSRRFAPLTRARLRNLLVRLAPGPFDIEAEGLRLRAFPADNQSDRVAMARGRLPDRDEREAIATMLYAGGVFVDIGANVGIYSLWAARKVGSSGIVLAVEPHPRTAARLAFNSAANGFTNVRIVQAAVGATASIAALHESTGGNVGQSSLIEDVAFRPDGRIEVPVRPLLDILAEVRIGAIDVLKIDIEGYEDRALVPFLREAPDALLPRAVVVETDVAERWESDCLAALLGRGYHPVTQTVANAVLTRDAARMGEQEPKWSN